ncbi:LOW QUALITY PROTEIN: filensin [Conger conger]|uniref:LOW QUALITY PROTEIN: filensin n=1 Tax=Conger conger TaxID=82655 RepID=UPI002A5A04BE|nr:LOW QUALITY PROTEIN: filensin [Conger conger]
MFKTSYRHEVRKEKYERSDEFEEPPSPDDYTPGSTGAQGWESLQELNERFARYINRARVLEQRNGVFRKQLETLQRMEEVSAAEDAFVEQIGLNRQRVRELLTDRAKLQRELTDAQRNLDEFNSRYRNECEYQEGLRGTLEQLNKEADGTLLRNLEFQILSQFLQDDINSTKDRHKKNLAEIQTYVNVLHKINQSIPLLPTVSVGISEEQEKLLAQRRVPTLQSQLEENKSALCQLQSQKSRLQTETASLEQVIKGTQDGYDDELQQYNEQIESLRREMEEAEHSLDKYTSECRRLALYQISLENELDRHQRIIENEDNRLNSAIIGTPVLLFTTSYRYNRPPHASSRGKDLTQAMQGITSIKPRQKVLAKKGLKRKELSPRDMVDSGQEEAQQEEEEQEEARGGGGEVREEPVRRAEQPLHFQDAGREDVPDGSQLSKAFDTLCSMVRDRMRRYRRPEPIADFYTQGRYVLVSGEASVLHPCFQSSSPSGGHVYVTICDQPYGPYDPYGPSPAPAPGPAPAPTPMRLLPPVPPRDDERGGRKADGREGEGEGEREGERGKEGREGERGGKGSQRGGEGGDPQPKSRDPGPCPAPGPAPGPSLPSGGQGYKDKPAERRRSPPPMPAPRSQLPVDSMSYEKVEMVESIEKISADSRVRGYEETATIVETVIEKTSKKKQGDRPA